MNPTVLASTLWSFINLTREITSEDIGCFAEKTHSILLEGSRFIPNPWFFLRLTFRLLDVGSKASILFLIWMVMGGAVAIIYLVRNFVVPCLCPILQAIGLLFCDGLFPNRTSQRAQVLDSNSMDIISFTFFNYDHRVLC